MAQGDGTGWSHSDLHILQNNVADANEATLANAVVTVKSNGNVGIGIANPDYKLMVNGDIGTYSTNQIYARYTTNETYKGSFNWYGLQLGNNGANYIIAGRTNVGGALNFVVNNTSDFPTVNGTTAMTIASAGNVSMSGALQVGGSETGIAGSDIKAYIQKVACEGRRGNWVDGSGCAEYAKYSATAAAWPGGACGAGYHICTFPDLFTGGFASLRRPGYANPVSGYVWIGGTYPANQDTFFYPWGSGTTLQCTAGSHYMMYLAKGASGNTAWGCYPDSYVNVAVCCVSAQ